MSLSLVNTVQQTPLQSFLDCKDVLGHVFSFLDEEASLQGVCKTFNLRCADAINKKLNQIQDVLIKAGLLKKEKRISFEANFTIKNVNKDLESGLSEIAKRIYGKMLDAIASRNTPADDKKIPRAILDLLKEKNVPFAEKLGAQCLIQQTRQGFDIGWQRRHPLFGLGWCGYNQQQYCLCEYFLQKNKPSLALYVADNLTVSDPYDQIIQQRCYALIALHLIEKGKEKIAINLLKRVREIAFKADLTTLMHKTFSGWTEELDHKIGLICDLRKACALLAEKGYITEAIENYQKCIKSDNVIGVEHHFVWHLLSQGVKKDTIIPLLRIRFDAEEADEILKRTTISYMLGHKKLDQLVAYIEHEDFLPKDKSYEYIWGHLCGYNWDSEKRIYLPYWKESGRFIRVLEHEELVSFLSKLKNPELRKFLLEKTADKLRELKKDQEALEVEKLMNSVDKIDLPEVTVSSKEQVKVKENACTNHSLTHEKAKPFHQVSTPASTLKKPIQVSSQSKTLNEQNSKTTVKKATKSCCLQGKAFVTEYWKQSLVFRIFSFLTFGLLPLITFLVGLFLRRQETAVR